MARILAISSWVAAGHVGLAAVTPALSLLGHTVIGLPTVVLSNHKAFPACAGAETPPETLRAMLDAVAANGWLDDLDAVLTGYLPTAAHAAFAAETVTRARAAAAGVRVVVDPVLGDDPKGLYLAEAAAAALRDRLVPLADILTPNRFELAWLTGAQVSTVAEAVAAAGLLGETGGATLGEPLGGTRALLTSPPLGPDETGVCAIAGGRATVWRAARIAGAPHGAGDVFAGLIAAGLAPGAAAGLLHALVAASRGRPHLAIAETAARWTGAPALAADPAP